MVTPRAKKGRVTLHLAPKHTLAQRVGSGFVLQAFDNGITKFEDGSRALTRDELTIDLHESSRAGGTPEFALETGIAGGALAIEQTEATQDERCCTDGSDRTTEIDVITQAFVEVRAVRKVGGARQTAREDQHIRVKEIDILQKGIGLDTDAMGTSDGELTCDRNNLQVETCTANDVGSSEGLNFLGASSKEEINHEIYGLLMKILFNESY